MELLIKIPKEFEQHFKQDAFEDSLHRLSADAHLIAGLYEQETAKMLRDAFKNAIPVPEHGRLINACALIDKLIAKYLEHERKGELVFAAAEIKQDIVDLISDAPTIIPASEEEMK